MMFILVVIPKGFLLLFYVNTIASLAPAVKPSFAMTKLQESLPDCTFQKFHCHTGVHAKFTSLDHQLWLCSIPKPRLEGFPLAAEYNK